MHILLAALLVLALHGPREGPAELDCWDDQSFSGSFSGSMSSKSVDGRSVIYEQVGSRGHVGIVQKMFGDVRVCLIAEGVGERGKTLPSRWLETSPRFVLETKRGSVTQRLDGVLENGRHRLTLRVGSNSRPFDGTAEQWRDRLLDVLDTTWELSTLRGEVSSLRGEISSIRGERSSLRGEISSMRGHVSSLRGEISSIRGQESSLRGRISSIRAHRSDDTEARVAVVEREIKALDVEGKIAAIERQIREYDVEKRVADVERRITALDVEGKVEAIEKKIAALDAERKSAALIEQRDQELKRLEAAIAALR